MTEYIKREDAIEAFYAATGDGDKADWAVGVIKSTPSADVVERKRGEWYDRGSLSCRCSNCRCKSPEEFSFCPNCGSDNRDQRLRWKSIL